MELLQVRRYNIHGTVKQEHHLCGSISLFADGIRMYTRRFSYPKQRSEIIESWYRLSPAIKNNYHYFEVQYDY